MDPDELRVEFGLLERTDQLSISDEVLWEKIRRIHAGFSFNSRILRPGLSIYRAVRVSEKPRYISRLSYPPSDRVKVRGRLNADGQVMFYGTVDAGNQYGACLYECHQKAGDLFAVSHWSITEPILVNHLGYSRTILHDKNPSRKFPEWTELPKQTETDKLIREWQCREFTKDVLEGSEHLYQITNALARFALSPLIQPDKSLPQEFAGVMYPTIAVSFIDDNIALLPKFVDSSLALVDVGLIHIPAVKETNRDGHARITETQINIVDTAYEFRSDGRIVWNRESTAMSVSPWPISR